MKTLFNPALRQDLLTRLANLTPDNTRQWGSMTAHQAVCHLNDSFKAILGDRPVGRKPVDLKRRLTRFAAFTLPIRWPEGVPTSPETNAQEGGTPPGEFERDVAELQSLVERFVKTDGRTLNPHYSWGAMSRGEWGRYGYRHIDHHLRQFGV